MVFCNVSSFFINFGFQKLYYIQNSYTCAKHLVCWSNTKCFSMRCVSLFSLSYFCSDHVWLMSLGALYELDLNGHPRNLFIACLKIGNHPTKLEGSLLNRRRLTWLNTWSSYRFEHIVWVYVLCCFKMSINFFDTDSAQIVYSWGLTSLHKKIICSSPFHHLERYVIVH